MNGPAGTTEGAATAFCRASRHRSSQRRAGEDRGRNDRSARVLYAPRRAAWRRHHGLCRYARGARDDREFEGWSGHDHDRKQNQLHRRGNGRQPRGRRDHAGAPLSPVNDVDNAQYDGLGEARCGRHANAASFMKRSGIIDLTQGLLRGAPSHKSSPQGFPRPRPGGNFPSRHTPGGGSRQRMKRRGASPRGGAGACFELLSFPPPLERSPHASVVFRHTCWCKGRSTMKHALIAIAGVGILAATAGVATANATYGPPPPPSSTPPPTASAAPTYAPAPRYPLPAHRRAARAPQPYGTNLVYTPGSGPPPYDVPRQVYASQSSGPWEWHAGPGPNKRGGMCVTHVDINRGYGYQATCPPPKR